MISPGCRRRLGPNLVSETKNLQIYSELIGIGPRQVHWGVQNGIIVQGYRSLYGPDKQTMLEAMPIIRSSRIASLHTCDPKS